MTSPVWGPSTIESMISAEAKVLAVEAGKTLIADYADMIARADEAGIAIVGIPAQGPVQEDGP